MSLVAGAPLVVEDLDVTMKVVTFVDPIATIYHKHKGKVSKRRFNNIMKMAHKRHSLHWATLLERNSEQVKEE